MSTVDNNFVLYGLISHIINSGRKLYCAFVDFTKAFDYIYPTKKRRRNAYSDMFLLSLPFLFQVVL